MFVEIINLPFIPMEDDERKERDERILSTGLIPNCEVEVIEAEPIQDVLIEFSDLSELQKNDKAAFSKLLNSKLAFIQSYTDYHIEKCLNAAVYCPASKLRLPKSLTPTKAINVNEFCSVDSNRLLLKYLSEKAKDFILNTLLTVYFTINKTNNKPLKVTRNKRICTYDGYMQTFIIGEESVDIIMQTVSMKVNLKDLE